MPKPAIDFVSPIKLKPTFDLPKDIEHIVVAILTSGAPPESAPIQVAATAPTEAAALTGASGKTCQILESLQANLQASLPVHQSLPRIPTRARSVANAVMLWDGRWVDQADLGGADAVGPIQQAVLQGILAAPPNCQTEIVRGPRLITIGDAQNTTVLAFGSGEWRWADLLSVIPSTQSENSPRP